MASLFFASLVFMQGAFNFFVFKQYCVRNLLRGRWVDQQLCSRSCLQARASSLSPCLSSAVGTASSPAMDIAASGPASPSPACLARASPGQRPAVGWPWFLLGELLCASGLGLVGPWLLWVRRLPLPCCPPWFPGRLPSCSSLLSVLPDTHSTELAGHLLSAG